MTPRRREIALHALRFTASLGGLYWASVSATPVGAAVASAALFFECFAALHDLVHGALRIRRQWNELLISIVGVLIMTSGHAMRRTHLDHHKLDLAEGDVEGVPAKQSFLLALVMGPAQFLALRTAAYRCSGPRGRAIQIAEHAASIALFVACFASGAMALRIYATVVLSAAMTAGLWGGHLPHNTPAWVLRVARRLAVSGSPTVLTLAYHDVHHARPDLPCQELHRAASLSS